MSDPEAPALAEGEVAVDEVTRKRAHETHDDDSGALPAKRTPDDGLMIKMLVPNRHAGALIGKGGENMKRLEGETGCRVKLSQATEFYPGTNDRVLSARGEAFQITAALRMVLESLEASARSALEDGAEPQPLSVRLVIPERATGSLIGKGGENIRRLQDECGCRISASSKDDVAAQLSERILSISDASNVVPQSGVETVANYLLNETPENMQYTNWSTSYSRSMAGPEMGIPGMPGAAMPYGMPMAYGMSQQGLLPYPGGGAMAAAVPPPGGDDTITIPCPNSCVGAVVGRGGENIREMIRLSGAVIKVSQKAQFLHGTKDRYVTITGPPPAQNLAHQLVYHKIQEAQLRNAMPAAQPY